MFFPGEPFQHSLMFVGKARSYTRVEHLKVASIGWASGLTHKHKTRLERLARDKHSSSLCKSVNYGRKNFYSTGQKLCDKKLTEKFSLKSFLLYHQGPRLGATTLSITTFNIMTLSITLKNETLGKMTPHNGAR